MQRDEVYRVYVTDMLMCIAENTAKFANGGGRYIKKRYFDIVQPQKEETRTPDEIINGIKSKLKGGNAK